MACMNALLTIERMGNEPFGHEGPNRMSTTDEFPRETQEGRGCRPQKSPAAYWLRRYALAACRPPQRTVRHGLYSPRGWRCAPPRRLGTMRIPFGSGDCA